MSILNNKNFTRSIPIAVTVLCPIIIISFINIFPGIIDLFMVLNLLFSVLVLSIVLKYEELSNFSTLPIVLLCSTVFTLIISLSITIQILAKGNGYKGWTIKTVSNLIVGIGSDIRLYISFGIFILIIIFIFMLIQKMVSRVQEVAFRFAIERKKIKLISIDTELLNNKITEDEAKNKKDIVQKEADFFASLDGVTKFISGNAKVCLFGFTLIIIGGGSIINVFFRGNFLLDAIKYYMRLSIGHGLVFLLPIAVASLTVCIVVTSLSFAKQTI